jgi:outer membrane autotransporter protein
MRMMKKYYLIPFLSLMLATPAAFAYTETVENQTVTGEAIGAGETQTVKSSGIARDGSISGTDADANKGSQIVDAGGKTYDMTVGVFGFQTVNSGGVVYDTNVRVEGTQTIANGGVANNTNATGGNVIVQSGGKSNETYLIMGGKETVMSGGTATGTKVAVSATQEVSGTAVNTDVGALGNQNVMSGGTATNTVLQGDLLGNNATQTVNLGGTATGTIVNNSGLQIVEGTATGTAVKSGGTQQVNSGGTTTNAVLESGAVQNVYGTSTTTTIKTGAVSTIGSGGVANKDVIEGGSQTLAYGAVSNDVVLNAGPTLETVGSRQIVEDGAIANATVVTGTKQGSGQPGNTLPSSSVQQIVQTGGVANDTVLNEYGYQVVSGVANDTVVNGKIAGLKDWLDNEFNVPTGVQHVFSGGVANDTVLNSGIQTIRNGGVANNTVVNGGGHVSVNSGGVINDVTVNDTGVLYLADGSEINGTNKLNKGTALGFWISSTNPGDVDVGGTGTINVDGATITTYSRDAVVYANSTLTPAIKGTGTIVVKGNTTAQAAGVDYDTMTFNDIEGTYKITYASTDSGKDHAEVIAGVVTDVQNKASFKANVELGAYSYKAQNNGGVVDLVRSGYSSAVLTPLAMAANSLGSIASLAEAMTARLGDLTLMSETAMINKNVWATYIYKNLKINDHKTTVNGGEAGFDLVSYQDTIQKFMIGVLAHYSQANPDFSFNSGSSDVDVKTYGGGIYAIWATRSGWFADAVIRALWYDQDVSNSSGGNKKSFDLGQLALTANVEAGKRISFPTSRGSWGTNEVFLTPRAEFAAVWLQGDDAKDSGGGKVKIEDATLYRGYLGATLGYKKHTGYVGVMEPYVKAGVIYDFGADTEARYNNTALTDDINGFKYEAGLGIKMKLTRYLTGFIDGTYQGGSDYRNIMGNAGLRWTF